MTFGYYLDSIERKKRNKGAYQPSMFKVNFDKNYGDNLASLLLAGKIIDSNIEFTDDEIMNYEELVHDHKFYSGDHKNIKLKERLEKITREKVIIDGVSSWECYFSDVSDNILIEPKLEKIYKDKEKFKKFLIRFNLKRDFEDQMLFNGYKIKNLEFANYIKNNDKINYQDLDKLKDFLSILYDIDIVKIEEKNWKDIVEFILDRHKLIHDKNNKGEYDKIMQKYTKEKIENILYIMKKLIDNIDNIFFTEFSIQIIPHNSIIV